MDKSYVFDGFFFQATEGKIGTDEKAICDIIKVRSREHLWAFNEAYRQRSKKGKTAIEVLQSETSGILELAFCAVFMQPASWYARAIHLAMKVNLWKESRKGKLFKVI